MWLLDILPGMGSKSAREEWDRLFSRDMLGSVIVGGHVMKIFEKFYNVIVLAVILKVLGVSTIKSIAVAFGLFVLWVIGSMISVYTFILWERIEQRIEEKKNELDNEQQTWSDY